ncbi:response regulator transcription factor [Beijerinckia indica]|uniref:Two component transcriptional regulator, LuxR family n=1 Tax=Beijerinckia indica subsp. indica (strain ATCC 9039 / DSM 1715 / NCIMB 8712) TaxID=395963 RepID=B2II35_BEII9|nr:response regulator transcription factor [Beijerinckia indica]ACB94618.1 two component transcriptional regulator, LuxR family [Beijerinckia indica subsp. indica ATCC 9039]
MTHSTQRRDIVLVVDDSPETLSFLTDALEAAGATVLIAVDGANALALVERITPDIILMDAVMPGMDGFETCRRLKRDKIVTHVPVIFMTALSDTEQIVMGLEAGGVDYVTKPIALDELMARMRVHLTNARETYSARAALDAAGRFLLSVNRLGRVLWSTPQATALLTTITSSAPVDGFLLPETVRCWLDGLRGKTGDETETFELRIENADRRLKISYVSQVGPDELLLRVMEDNTLSPEQTLKTRLNLTSREAEVLTWVARGKSNRDIGEILGLSPRTVDKHLEQVYAKIGVENRVAATALAIQTLTPK